MKFNNAAIITAAGLLFSTAAYAGPSLSIGGGSTGVSAHLSLPINDALRLRIGTNYAKVDYFGSTGDADYDYTLRLRMHDLLLDWHPALGSFRLTGGMVYNGNRVLTNTRPKSGTYEIGGVTYNAGEAGTIHGETSFRKYAPYLGIGWGTAGASDRRWHFSGDIGVLFQGSPRTELSNSGCQQSFTMDCDRLSSDIEREEQQINEDMKDIKMYPVLRFGVAYRF